MQKIDPRDYEKSIEKIGGIFAQISQHADEQALSRCPYKNRLDQCTALFGCRYRRPAGKEGELPICTSDDQLDYRSAWDSDAADYDAVRDQLRKQASLRSPPDDRATICHGDQWATATAGKTVFDFADELQVRVPTSCSRTGHCHECVVEVTQGMTALGSRTESERFLSGNYRLACQAEVVNENEDIEFSLLRRIPKILAAQPSLELELAPLVQRQGEQVFYDGQVVDRYRGKIYGMAIDLGTTTVVAELVDLETGVTVYVASFENPQRFGGSDVMHRISYDAGAFQGELHRAVINMLNTEIEEMCAVLGIERHVIYEFVIVGNSTMRELFFGLDVQSIGQRPYKSFVESEYREGRRATTTLSEPARSLRLRANKNARVFGAPLIASHVGGDVAADLVAVDMATQDEVAMLVDVGTNTEVVIGHQGRLVAASCPAGPAFEGGLVSYGMPGCDGAIESLRRVGDQFEYRTIGDVAPRGICGSGLIDLLAELRRHQIMTPKGVFADKARELSIVPQQGITLSRADASHLAQAKAANYCGQWILMRHFGVVPDQISKLYLAGGFANFVDPASAIEIGFLAPVPEERIIKVGNAAAQGAREMLLSRGKRSEIERLVQTIEHVELETADDFFEIFVEACQFKPMQCSGTNPRD